MSVYASVLAVLVVDLRKDTLSLLLERKWQLRDEKKDPGTSKKERQKKHPRPRKEEEKCSKNVSSDRTTRSLYWRNMEKPSHWRVLWLATS